MVWQQNVDRIVMVSNLVEGSKKRVEQYWPSQLGDIRPFGEFVVTLESEETCGDYVTRMMTLQFENESRWVCQFHFTSWPNKSKPSFGVSTLLSVMRNVHSLDEHSHGPLTVHCSAGIGRTGTFIALDLLLDQIQAEDQVDIYGCVYRLRQERMNMVQSKEQYYFLHDAVLVYINTGHTAYPCAGFREKLATLSVSNNGGPSELQRQYQTLQKLKSGWDGSDREGLSAANREKNRDMTIIPGDTDRPYLSTHYSEGSDYINAVYVDSFKMHNWYIVTQMPLLNTKVDFWRLILDHNCHTIIMLNEVNPNDPNCDEYWPDQDDTECQYGPVNVELTHEEQVTDYIVMRNFKNQSGTSRRSTVSKPQVVRHFQLLGWPQDRTLPGRKQDLLDLMDEVRKWQQQREESSTRIGGTVVHCLDGRALSGIFCGVAYTLDRMKVEQEVDAFVAARNVCRQRPQFFRSPEEFNALFEMAVTCMDKYT